MKLRIIYSMAGCDRWLFIWGKTIRGAWDAPRGLSFRKGDGKLRGGC